MKEPNHALIRERCTYPAPQFPGQKQADSRYEWKFEDCFGNRFGRFFHRPSVPAESASAETVAWNDVFGRDVHLSEFRAGTDFAVAATADDRGFAIHRIVPSAGPVEIFRQREKLLLHGLSPDDRFLLVQAARDENWFRPELLVMDLEGRVLSRLGSHAGVDGCGGGEWSPVKGDCRAIVHHEATGFLRPAIWLPFENRVEEILPGLEGEVVAKWDRTGRALLLNRALDGRSDLHRLDLHTGAVEMLQPLDGVVFRHEPDEENRVIGMWSANHRHVQRFCERDRFVTAGLQVSVSLTPWSFRRIAGVPCFVVGEPRSDAPQWTVFDGYGGFAHHHTDGYNWKTHVLADHGFFVVMVNARGCSGFGRAWREASLGDLGHTELEDMRRVRRALVEEGVVDGNRTILTGDSWGGYMTLLGMGTQPDIWRMGVAGTPVGDFERAYWEASPLIRSVNRTQFGGDARTHAHVYRKASPMTYIDAIRGPVLMIAGKYDPWCPPKQNIAFADALRARGGDCELHLFEGGHGAPDREERIRQQTATVGFLLRHCAAMDAG